MDVDVVIIGAGIAGSIAAIALAPSRGVLLIDKQVVPSARIGESLPPVARRVLHRLDLLSRFEQQPHLESQGMASYWGSDQLELVDHIRNPDGFGWHLDRKLFEKFLRESAQRRGAAVLWPAKISACHFHRRRWRLTTDSGHEISANFVIDAGGRRAPFARLLGIRREVVDRLVTCWARLRRSQTNGLGLIAATGIGWWYSAPIPGNELVLGLQTDPDLVNSRVKKHLPEFLELAMETPPIAALLKGVAGEAAVETGIHNGVSAANSTRLTMVAGERWAALGDAAISVDPLSSQGMYHAMASAMQLAEILISGETGLGEYQAQITRIWQQYRRHHRTYYQQEQRWSRAPFWQRRH